MGTEDSAKSKELLYLMARVGFLHTRINFTFHVTD